MIDVAVAVAVRHSVRNQQNEIQSIGQEVPELVVITRIAYQVYGVK